MALWDLVVPIFLGTLLALVALAALVGRAGELLTGPRAALAWLNAAAAPRRRRGHGGHGGPMMGGGCPHAAAAAARRAAESSSATHGSTEDRRRQWKVARRWGPRAETYANMAGAEKPDEPVAADSVTGAPVPA